MRGAGLQFNGVSGEVPEVGSHLLLDDTQCEGDND